jgi:hypothetical protein
MCVYFYYHFVLKKILINKFSKYNQVNIPFYDIKYLDLYLFFFLVLFVVIVYDFYLLHIFIDLFDYMYL